MVFLLSNAESKEGHDSLPTLGSKDRFLLFDECRPFFKRKNSFSNVKVASFHRQETKGWNGFVAVKNAKPEGWTQFKINNPYPGGFHYNLLDSQCIIRSVVSMFSEQCPSTAHLCFLFARKIFQDEVCLVNFPVVEWTEPVRHRISVRL